MFTFRFVVLCTLFVRQIFVEWNELNYFVGTRDAKAHLEITAMYNIY